MAFRAVITFCRKFYIQLINLVSSLLPDDRLSCVLRAFLYRTLGNKIALSTVINGGGRVCGSGLEVGGGTFINRSTYFDLTGPIRVGNNCSIGHGVAFITAHHEMGPASKRAGMVRPMDIEIGDGVWIGASAKILPGVRIGDGAVVGAASVVTKSVPANALVLGTPAKIVRFLD